MHSLVDGIVGVIHAFDRGEGIVKVRLLKAFSVSVDVVKTTVGVHRDKVGRDAHMAAVPLVAFIEPKVSIAFEPMVKLDPGSDRRESWSGNVSKWVYQAIVEDVSDGLIILVLVWGFWRGFICGDGGEWGWNGLELE